MKVAQAHNTIKKFGMVIDLDKCTGCGACMVGCRVGAKNTLQKNYLWFAERADVELHLEKGVLVEAGDSEVVS